MVNHNARRAEFDVLARNLKRIRAERGWRQADLAEALGIRQSEVARWEARSVVPRAGTVAKIATTLGVSTDDLLTKAKWS